tara:strand:- start:420 stop:785 length:366 start_codon:yes stop_codon:yes gene_type:complete
MDSETLQELVYQTIKILSPEVPGGIAWLHTWESIKFPEGYEKPPKEEFDAKLQELMAAQPLKELRTKRNKVISSTDYLFTSDFPHATPEKKQEWLDYRQALRDLPTATEDPANPVWPVPPE